MGKLLENDKLCKQMLFRKQGQKLWHLFFVNENIHNKTTKCRQNNAAVNFLGAQLSSDEQNWRSLKNTLFTW